MAGGVYGQSPVSYFELLLQLVIILFKASYAKTQRGQNSLMRELLAAGFPFTAHPYGDTGRTNESEFLTDNAPHRIQLSYTPNTVESFDRLKDRWVDVLKKSGQATTHVPLHAYFKKRIPLEGVGHQNGTCRIGNDPATSVLDSFCKAHDLDNLYVVDASCFVSASAVNPSLTIIANAIGVSDHLLQKRLK